MCVCVCLFVALLSLRTEAEWEEVKKTVFSQAQDSSISEEFYRVSKYWLTTTCLLKLDSDPKFAYVNPLGVS